MTEYLIGGYISVSAVIENNSREIKKIILDTERQSRIRSASYHYPEKAQYKALEKYISSSGTPVEYLSAEDFASLTNGGSYGGVAALVGDRIFENAEDIINKARFALILDGIEDPFNFGYVLRTAYACGCDCVLLPRRNYFTSSSVVIRSSAGASEILPIALFDKPDSICETLRSNGFSIICTAKSRDSVPLEQARVTPPVCLVIGGEKRGINKELMSYADSVVCIDYKNQYKMSLSASSASSILIYGVASRM